MKTFEINTSLKYKTSDNYRGVIVQIKGKKKKKPKYLEKNSQKV